MRNVLQNVLQRNMQVCLILDMSVVGAAQQPLQCDTSLRITEDRQQLLVSVSGITTLCLLCINPATMTTDTVAMWDFPDQPTLTNGQDSSDGLIKIRNGIAGLINPQTKIIDGPDEYEVACVGVGYSLERIELFTDSKYNSLRFMSSTVLYIK